MIEAVLIGVPFFVIGIFALLTKPRPSYPAHAEDSSNPRKADLVGSEKADAVQIAEGEEVEAAYLLLKSAGIPAFLKSSVSPIQYPNWTHPGEQGDLLMVPQSSLARAQEVLNSRVSDEDLNAQAEAALPPDATSDRNPNK